MAVTRAGGGAVLAAVAALAAAGCSGSAAGPGGPAPVSAAVAAGSERPAATGTPGGAPGAPGGSPGAAGRAPASINGTVLGNPLLTTAGGGLYLRWDLRPEPPVTPSPQGIARVDPASGAVIAADTAIAAPLSPPVFAAGALWVTESRPGGEDLLRLDPGTLAVTGQVQVTGETAAYPGSPSGTPVAFAGGLVWADGYGRLTGVDPATLAVRRAVTFRPPRGAGPLTESTATASPDGRALIVSESTAGIGAIQRRDPSTGALLASVPSFGVSGPLLSEVVAGGVWVSVPTGLMGYAERLSTATLRRAQPAGLSRPAEPGTSVEGSNAIHAHLWGGVLWVTDPNRSARLNYCADPVTGERLAGSPLPDLSGDEPLTVAGQREYYAAAVPGGFAVRSVPVPAACR